jgi:glycine/D-amino acid oxidase-like deaminating enzyme
MMKNKKKVLIIGAGLSGISVASQLIKHDVEVTLVDNGINYSSRIAAGMINPLVFRRMTKSWRVDEFIPFLKKYYREYESLTNSKFLFDVNIRRLFSSEQERNFWLEKENREDFRSYMHNVSSEDMEYAGAKNPFGSGRLKETFFVEVDSFLTNMKSWIQENGTILTEEFDYSQLEGTSYKGTQYDDLVFCLGYLNKSCPFFGELPLDQTKGQTLTIKSLTLPEDLSLNRKCFMLPKGNHTFKIGSTYEWSDPTTHVTEEGKLELLNNLSYIIDEEVEVLNQEAGVRPTTRDRRPLLGTHHTIKNYHIFNGLGAKGYMLAPLISKEFVSYLLNDDNLDPEVDINRYYRKNNQ